MIDSLVARDDGAVRIGGWGMFYNLEALGGDDFPFLAINELGADRQALVRRLGEEFLLPMKNLGV